MLSPWKIALLVAAVCVAIALAVKHARAQAPPDGPKTPSIDRLVDRAVQRAKIMNCMEGSVARFDDRISPANVVASAVAWHCEAESKPENYWVILSMRTTTLDTVDQFYRDLALPFVLQYRAKQVRKD